MRIDHNRQSISHDLIERALRSDRDALPRQPGVPNAELLSAMKSDATLRSTSASHVIAAGTLLKSIGAILTLSVIGTGVYLAWPSSVPPASAPALLNKDNQPGAFYRRGDGSQHKTTTSAVSGIPHRNHPATEAHSALPIVPPASATDHANHDLLMPSGSPKNYTNPRTQIQLHNSDSAVSPAVHRIKQ